MAEIGTPEELEERVSLADPSALVTYSEEFGWILHVKRNGGKKTSALDPAYCCYGIGGTYKMAIDSLNRYYGLSLDPKRAEVIHGQTCNKEPHTRGGYLHNENDDTPYLVDGYRYCGRCHCAL